MNKYTKLILFLCLIFTSGCDIVTLPEYYRCAEDLCKLNGGVKELTTVGPLFPKVKCNNGATFQLTNEYDLEKYK